MKAKYLFVLLLLLKVLFTQAQQQRALLIGINDYAPPANYTPSSTVGRLDFPDLDGCTNDALSIYSIINSKFSFEQKNIDTLFNKSASREAILNGFKALLNKSNTGDVAFIYYAGHGSQVKNSLSFEVNQLDQTMVPSDSWKEGVKDIRDKELSKIFNAFVDKGIKLTVIFDCCHSGSISRGPNSNPGKLRYMPMSNWDAKDATKFEIPEKRDGNNFLIFSAAQSDEFAAEQIDDKGIAHGAFTIALIDALNQQSVDASALSIFTSARAILKSNGKKQEPIIGGTNERQQQTLFGIKKGKLTDFSFVAVTDVKENYVQLQAGFALGLYKENELAMFNEKKDTLFVLKIDTVLGVNKSRASVIKGNIKDIKPGYQFRVINWVSAGRPLLKIFIPKSDLADKDISKFVLVANELRQSKKTKWQSNIGKGSKDPYATVFWMNNKCFIKVDKNEAIEVKEITAQNILQHCKKDSSLYVELPLKKEVYESYYKSLAANKSLKIVDDASASNYVLFGRLNENFNPAYGFRKTEVATKDSLEAMPIETDCFEFTAANENKIFETAMKLSKIRGWLNMAAPNGSSEKSFAFHLELFNEDKKKTIKDGLYKIGENISYKLVADDDYYSVVPKPKYVYVFAIDQSGAMQLFYPSDDGNVDNKYPKTANGELIKEITIIKGVIPAPSGTDNYFVLACDEPITNPSQVFNQEGVSSGIRGSKGVSDSNPLLDLLDIGNEGSRGAPKKLSTTWSLQKFSFRCTY
jgi:hypothetical protein